MSSTRPRCARRRPSRSRRHGGPRRCCGNARSRRRATRAARTVGADAVQGPGDDPRGRRLAGHAGEDKRMRHPAAGDRVRQGAHHRFLADEVGEGLRPVFAAHAIRGRLASVMPRGPGRRSEKRLQETEQTTQAELVIASSGPDRVGEGPVRRRPQRTIRCRWARGLRGRFDETAISLKRRSGSEASCIRPSTIVAALAARRASQRHDTPKARRYSLSPRAELAAEL